jgi:hypothetical protein
VTHLNAIKESDMIRIKNLRVDEGNHDVSGALGDAQPLVVVGQTTRVHQHPALAGIPHRAVVADETTSSALN